MSDFDAVMIKKTELERLRAEIERLQAEDAISHALLVDAKAEIERLRADKAELIKKRNADEIERLRAELALYKLRALLAQYQVANYAPEDSDLYEEARRALEGK